MWLQGWGQAPMLVKQCFASWQQLNPGWKVVLLDESNLGDFVDIESILQVNKDLISNQARSDIARINLLKRHGGVWVDATCVCRRPLDSWLGHYIESGFFAFHEPDRSKPLSSWFLAAVKASTIAEKYCTIVTRYWTSIRFINQHTFIGRMADKCVVKLLRNGDYRSKHFHWLFWVTVKLKMYPYFWFHYLFAEMLASETSIRELWDRAPKYSADAPHRLKHFGLLKQITPDLERAILEEETPLYKLDWRCGEKNHNPESVLSHVLNRASLDCKTIQESLTGPRPPISHGLAQI